MSHDTQTTDRTTGEHSSPEEARVDARVEARVDARVEAAFAPVLERIADGAVARERERRLPVAEVDELRRAGFGALRVPVSHGGWGASLEQEYRLLVRLGEADSNLPQLLRGHVAFVETQRAQPDGPLRDEWLHRLAAGDVLVGNAQAERGAATEVTTRLEQRGDDLVLTGRKYYSTGTIYSDWIWVGAVRVGGDRDGERVALSVRADAPGVTRVDDWAGFGQRLTGSGTTVFDDVVVDPRQVIPWGENAERRPLAHAQSLYQLVLLAALSGTARAVVRDAVAFVRPRTRTFGVGGTSSPREDPLVQRVVGRLSSIASSVEAITLAAVRQVDVADRADAADDGHGARWEDVLVRVFEAQQVVLPLVLEAATSLFEVGGASAVDTELALDRHWRNARTIASHNPAILRERAVGDYRLNGVLPAAPGAPAPSSR
ncbi:acyl-CoA dehydrogenase family protein [Frigoribacterium endophyticum]|uniref:acyl-CoA dehydrogenase family protein n=1 Tax=Frigoribacterium endophyticum TaxID=1522176 RepID=UPI001423DF45|nr:acyl-CoA dehydrogenase family protein [Frigoribacterium endophyticum]NII52656.1 alkylation response protein AidB-like acyl-CoA dehydrogenase [Frigoribacterium endophyticum]